MLLVLEPARLEIGTHLIGTHLFEFDSLPKYFLIVIGSCVTIGSNFFIHAGGWVGTAPFSRSIRECLGENTPADFSLRLLKYSVSERISIVKAYYSSNNSPIAAQGKFATECKLKTTGPSAITIKNGIEKFDRTGSADVSALQRFLQNFYLCLRHAIAVDGKHIEHVIN
ncbi:hypothetical protein AVEN_87044-1 [Araneus ventricosus]|uniref:DUF4817 domain-containing protein n=1 Tax=Araneus ventricosus TaxID=182803 RepID=A0A4Y2V163_ARAVE|nr:hypothetical protein AVEN_87044-1 [Araneus ventricosus]